MPARLMQSTIAATLAASAISFAPAAHADRLGFSVAIGGPGYAVAFGNAPYWGRPAWPAYGYRSQHFRPQWRPVHAPPPAGYVVAGYVVSSYAPPGVYAPRAAHAPPVIYRRHYAHHPGVESYRDRRVDHDRD